MRLLNLGGLLDFVGAITTGVLTSNASLGVFAPTTPMPSMGMMPLSLVPSFLVPLWTIIHFASLLQLRRARGEPRPCVVSGPVRRWRARAAVKVRRRIRGDGQ